MSRSEAAEILEAVADGGDREPGGEENYLAWLKAATKAETARDALRILAELPYANEAERLVRRENALRAAKACPAELSAPASLVNEYFPLKLAGRETTRSGTRHGLGLEDPEPWPKEVPGAELLAELEALFCRRVVLPNGGAVALALWTIFTYCFDTFDTCPLLALSSPEKQCGKTRTMDLLTYLCRRAMPTSNVSSAVVYRVIEQACPTLLFDEADAVFGPRRSGDKREELRSILNSGHTRSMAFVLRCDGDSHTPRSFSTWAPKALALIGRLPETLEDRSIVIPMSRKLRSEEVERFRTGSLEKELLHFRCKALRWANDHREELANLDPGIPTGLGDREADNWRPLLAIADCAAGEWPSKARDAVQKLRASRLGDERDSFGALLLGDLWELFERTGQDRLFTEQILEDLSAREDRPWGDWGNTGGPIKPQGLARFLKPYGIRPRDIRIGDDHKKGYLRSEFKESWDRYARPATIRDTATNPD